MPARQRGWPVKELDWGIVIVHRTVHTGGDDASVAKTP